MVTLEMNVNTTCAMVYHQTMVRFVALMDLAFRLMFVFVKKGGQELIVKYQYVMNKLAQQLALVKMAPVFIQILVNAQLDSMELNVNFQYALEEYQQIQQFAQMIYMEDVLLQILVCAILDTKEVNVKTQFAME